MEPKKKKILIVDDDSFLLDMYAMTFNQSDFDVVTALGPDQALEKLKSQYVPDVMLLDIAMPDMDGFKLIKKIKEEKLIGIDRIITLSNRGEPADIARGEKLGVAGCIVKAENTPAEVIEKVNTILGFSK